MLTAPLAHANDSWTGIYVGVGGGLSMANHELNFSNGPLIPPPPAFNVGINGLGGDGGFFTLGMGVDYQVSHTFVVGAFFDYDWMNVDTSINASFGGLAANANFAVDDQWAIGGRIGYLASANTMLFVTGGYTRADISDMTFSVAGFNGVLASTGNVSGLFIGAGAEYKLGNGLSLKGEYRYNNYGPENVTLLPTLFPAINGLVTTKLDTSVQTARLSLNYKFGLGHSDSEGEAESEPVVGASTGSWTAFYVGVGAGLGIANHELNFSNGPLIPPPPAFNVGLDGLGGHGELLTVGVGADYQVNRNIVVGAFFDYDWMNVDTSFNAAFGGFAANAKFGVEDQWYLGARLGYLTSANTMLFISGGYTRADISDMTFSAAGFNGVLASTGNASGYFLGGGAEIKLTDNLTLKGEYRYSNFGSENVTLLPTLFPAVNNFVTTTIDPTVQSARLSLVYRFNLDGPAASEPLK